MSTPTHDSKTQPAVQELDLNDVAWNEVVATKLPTYLEEQARLHKAWSRKRGVGSVSDLLSSALGICLLPVFLPGTGNVGRAQRDWSAFRASMAQTARTVTTLDCVVALRTVRSASKTSLATQRSGTSAHHRCDAMENASRNGR